MRISILLLLAVLTTQCQSNKKDAIYDQYFKPELEKMGYKQFSGKIIAFADETCRGCAYTILSKNTQTDCETIMIYDTLVFGNITQTDSCHRVIATNNDVLARINFPNIWGHRIYWINNNRITRVKELNTKNADSLSFFLSTEE